MELERLGIIQQLTTRCGETEVKSTVTQERARGAKTDKPTTLHVGTASTQTVDDEMATRMEQLAKATRLLRRIEQSLGATEARRF